MITLIVARATNGAIGRNGRIPWNIPEDLRSFQKETLGGALIMGRKTWESLPVRPLSKRLNIVVSAHPEIAELVAPTIPAAIEVAYNKGYGRIYGIGGTRIYEEMLPFADRLLISEVEIAINDADTFFHIPHLDAWHLLNEQPVRMEAPKCLIREYRRRL